MQATEKAIAVINAEGLILGRMATIVAKRLQLHEQIIVVNAEKAVLSGKKRNKLKDAKKFLEVGYPRIGPFHYRRPDRIVRKSIRGMLPFKQPKGKQAFKRLKVYIGVPDNLRSQKMETLADAEARRLSCPYYTLGEFAREIGWNVGE